MQMVETDLEEAPNASKPGLTWGSNPANGAFAEVPDQLLFSGPYTCEENARGLRSKSTW